MLAHRKAFVVDSGGGGGVVDDDVVVLLEDIADSAGKYGI